MQDAQILQRIDLTKLREDIAAFLKVIAQIDDKTLNPMQLSQILADLMQRFLKACFSFESGKWREIYFYFQC